METRPRPAPFLPRRPGEPIRLVFPPARNAAVTSRCRLPKRDADSRLSAMTYCLGMLLDAGLVLVADTRTNAGVDNFSSFKKLHTLVDEPDRQIFACTAGSLSMSQSVIGLVQEGLPAAAEGMAGGGEVTRSLRHATTMFRAAQLIGEAVQTANATVGRALATINIESWVSLLLGGRIGGGPPMLFLVYNAGNFIECTPEVPLLQIGEIKYRQPILHRVLASQTPLREARQLPFL